MLAGDGIGEIGEGRRALVGSDDKIGVVVIMAHDIVGRNHRPVGEIIGDVEQS